jgi:hypothetical protein
LLATPLTLPPSASSSPPPPPPPPTALSNSSPAKSKFAAHKTHIFKGTVQRDLLPLIFSQLASSQALYWVSESFSNLVCDFFFLTLCYLYREEFILPVCLIWRVATLHINYRGELKMYEFCRNSGLPLDTGSRYSQYYLIWKFTTPHIVSSGKSFKPILKHSHAFKRILKQKIDCAYKALLTGNILKELKMRVALGSKSLLPVVNDSGETISGYFELEKLNSKNSTKFEVVVRISHLIKKMGVQNLFGLSFKERKREVTKRKDTHM